MGLVEDSVGNLIFSHTIDLNMVLFPWQDDSKQASYAPDQLDLFPTSLCGVLVFDSVSRRLLLRLRLLRRPSVSLTQLCHTPSFTHHLTHTTLSHTQLGRRGTVALGDIYLRLAWQAWRLLPLAGSGGALGRRWSPGAPRHFAWQACHLVTSTFVSRGRRGTCGMWLALVARLVAVGRPRRRATLRGRRGT